MANEIRRLGLALLACLLASVPAFAAAQDAGPLVSVAWLERNLARTDLTIIDASPQKAYAAAHIPGAIHVDFFSYGAREAPQAEMETRFQSWGLSPGRKVVIYDPGGTYLATRVFFDLVHRGYPAKDVAILDGGLAKWRAEGGRVTQDPTPAPAEGTFRISRVDESVRVRLPEFLLATGDTERNTLIEALEPSWHFGETAFFDRAGHVPNAIMLPSEDFFNADKTWKSPGEMRRMLAYLGVRPEQRIHSYCGGGIAASVPFFALKYLLDYPDVKLYQESQLEWLKDDRGLPFWTYDAPYLARDTPWLKAWGGGVIRMYGLANVSIVDVRSPEAFRQAHLPFAVNVPAEVIARHLNDPAGLAGVLGRAGVDRAHEAVVVSDAGLDARSALAFAALQSVGQQRTSVFMDSLDRWAELGQPVSRESAGSGSGRAPASGAASATSYTVAPRLTPLVADPSVTRGVYPKVYLASGKALPLRKPDGKVVHVPYSELLKPDGTPKLAKDIWNTLAKAGVPRYAEIICFADDPGEAAANYFVMKLMGFPDVKVWVLPTS